MTGVVLSTSRSELGPCLVGDWGLGWFLSPFERRPRSRFRSRACYLPRTRYLSRSRYRSCSRSRSCSCSRSRSRSHSRSRSCSRSRSHARARARSHSRAVLVGRCSRTSDRRRPRRVRAEVGQSPLSSSVSSVDDTHRRSTWEDRAGGWAGLGGVHFDHAPVKGALSNEMHSHPGCCCSGASEHSRG